MNPRHLLIVRISAFGDCVDVIPSVLLLRRHFPNDRITWLIKKPYASFVAPVCDEVIAFEPTLSGFFKALSQIRQAKCDVAIDFQGNLRSALLIGLSGIRQRFGYTAPTAIEGASYIYTRHYSSAPSLTRLERSLRLTSEMFGIEKEFIWPETSCFDADPERARELVSEGHDIVLAPTTSERGHFKRWPIERWKRLIAISPEKMKFLVVYGPGEQEIAKEVVQADPQRIRLAPYLSLGQLSSVLIRSRLVIGADTGTMHLAHLLNRPTVVLFGPKDPKAYGPEHNRHAILYDKQACSPCRNWRCDHKSCMWSIDSQRVLASAQNLLETVS